MAFNDKDGTGYVSFKDTVVPTAGKTVTAEGFKTESQELTLMIIRANFYYQN